MSVVVGEEPGFRSLENAEFSSLESGGVFFGKDPFASGFHTDHRNVFIADEEMQKLWLAFQDSYARSGQPATDMEQGKGYKRGQDEPAHQMGLLDADVTDAGK